MNDSVAESLNRRLSGQLRQRILSGALPSETRLPSIRELAREQGVSVITVQRAYDDLRREGLVRAQRGRGYSIAPLSERQRQETALRRLGEALEPVLADAVAAGLKADEIHAVTAFLISRLEG